ncbi:hypothetical protein BurJ1DRAFT_1921 [Burkholderiales bacterium JOSHI_001]|nr:hypothetical protein BurJ1DRAFT_1921 [Burkholderiales bacterium JOSHI_001]
MIAQEEKFYMSYMSLRQTIGWIGLTMPIAVRVGGWFFERITTLDTISDYYYTGMREVFVLALVLVGALLTCYRTPDKLDGWIGIIAGIAAFGIALFPVDPSFADELKDKYPGAGNKECYINHGLIGYHVYFVGTFFALAFYLMYFRFSAHTPPNPTQQKIIRNKIYKVCAITMLLAGIAMAAFGRLKMGDAMFWAESLSVMSFAAAWLVKGQFILRDSAQSSRVAA